MKLPKLPLRSRTCGCRTCGLVFTGAEGFNRHRVGELNLAAPHYGRRCLTPEELIKLGFKKDPKGRWSARPGRKYTRTSSIRSGGGGEPEAVPDSASASIPGNVALRSTPGDRND